MEQDKKDWDLHPENYRTENDDGITFILKKDGTPKKKVGRPKGNTSNYNYHSKTKARISARRSVRAKQKRIVKLKNQISAQKSSLKKQKKVLKKLDNKTDNQVIIDSDLDSLPPTVQEKIEQDNVVFHPNKGLRHYFKSKAKIISCK